MPPTIHFLATLCSHKFFCPIEAPVRNLQVEKDKVVGFFPVFNRSSSSRLLRTTAVTGIQPHNLRNISSTGLWEPTTQDCLTSSNRNSSPPSSSSASNTGSWPPAPGGNSFLILGAATPSPFDTSLQSFCYLWHCFPSFNFLLLILRWVPLFWMGSATQWNQCNSKTSSLPVIPGSKLKVLMYIFQLRLQNLSIDTKI